MGVSDQNCFIVWVPLKSRICGTEWNQFYLLNSYSSKNVFFILQNYTNELWSNEREYEYDVTSLAQKPHCLDDI